MNERASQDLCHGLLLIFKEHYEDFKTITPYKQIQGSANIVQK
jgi:hypothetical protein